MKKIGVIIGSVLGLIIIAYVASQFIKLPPGTVSESVEPTNNISAIIIPHHDLVKVQRQEFLTSIAGKIETPQTIILLSPNHYEVGSSDIQTTDQTWQISSGSIEPNETVIDTISEFTSNTSGSFANEHGIKLVLGDIWQHFPAAKIVPIIFKLGTKPETVASLEAKLEQSCVNCLVIASVDFSHYQPAQLADLHDTLTTRALGDLDTEKIYADAEVDSPAALAFTMLWAKSRNAEKFTASNHTNSGLITKQIDAESTSHVFGYYSSDTKVASTKEVSFIIGGDAMFGRMIAHTFLKDGLWKSFDQLGNRTFWGTDGSIINLEGPVSATAVPDNIEPDNLHFNFPPETISALKYLNVKAASLANNHSGNAGSAGLENTRSMLTSAGIQPLGGPGSTDVERVISFKGEGMTLDIIGLHALVSQPDLTALIHKLKTDPTHRVLVFPHWGVEYQPKHSSLQERLAHSWIDAGADIVIGAHPHVIQDAEVYKDRPIFYSLGNLLFDQTFSVPTQEGLIIAGELTEKNIRLFVLPVESKKLKPVLMRGTEKAKLLDNLYGSISTYVTTEPSGRFVDVPIN